MNKNLGNENSLVFSYLQLRKVIGLLGITFPFILSLGALILFKTGMQGSISSYYHTGMQDVFVGTLCVIGFFLLSYKGYNLWDNIVGDLGCVFAVGLALFPTRPAGVTSSLTNIIGYVHLAFAILFFSTLICFSLFLFTKTDSKIPPTRKKLQRNKVYRVCGYVMGICILLIAIYFFLPNKIALLFQRYNPVYWLEALAIFTFGISWLTKGETILKDKVLTSDIIVYKSYI